MIDLSNKYDCCGCMACIQACPKHCICKIEDKEGFVYPKVDTSVCVNCGLCESACPALNKTEAKEPTIVYAAKNSDNSVRKKSSSGGVFSVLAETIIAHGGVVFGARFDDRWTVIHDYTETLEGLSAFQGSKYVQSHIGDSYKKAQEFLNKDRMVLFTGTPCQIAGLKTFLRKDYDQLFCVDVICHGVPSPGVFRWYLQEQVNTIVQHKLKHPAFLNQITNIPSTSLKLPDGFEIKSIRFRDKRFGWRNYSFVIHMYEEKSGSKCESIDFSSSIIENVYLRGFVRCLFLRPSCHHCSFKGYKSGSDITLGDFWGQNELFPDFDQDTGVSAVLIYTNKGNMLFNMTNGIVYLQKTLKQVLAYNPSLIHSSPISIYRKKFWKLPLKYSFEQRVKKALKLTFLEQAYVKLHHIF